MLQTSQSVLKTLKTVIMTTGLCFAVTNALAQTGDADSTAETTDGVLDLSNEWMVCNESSFVLNVVTTTRENETYADVTQTRIRPGDCEPFTPPVGQTRYIYAESSPAYQGSIREWNGRTPLCLIERTVKVPSNRGCADSSAVLRGFMEVSSREPVTRLVEPDNYGKKAQTAGLQRLIRDNGYDITRIDGVAGRRTNRLLAQALQERTESEAKTPEAQIDALEIAAREYVKTVGINICNSSSGDVWVATARRHKTTWRSDGWWKIIAGDCAHVYSESLIDRDVHFYARQEPPKSSGESGDTDNQNITDTPRPDRNLRVAEDDGQTFCISESRFSALGRENCPDNGYKAARFRALPGDKAGADINVTDTDFVEKALTGLRR